MAASVIATRTHALFAAQFGHGKGQPLHCHHAPSTGYHGGPLTKPRQWKSRSVSHTCHQSSSSTGAQRRGYKQLPHVRAAASEDSPVIDVEATVRPNKFLVLGGAGFVGSAVCKAAVKAGLEVISLSRKGQAFASEPWMDQVQWEKGDVFTADWYSLLYGVSTVMSCIGGFGTNDQMEKVCGDATITAAEAAHREGADRFLFVSVHNYNFPSFAKDNGYFHGKERAAQRVLELFPGNAVILQPGFIYGTRYISASASLPLAPVGKLAESVLSVLGPIKKPLSSLPGSDLLLAPPVSVDDVGKAAVAAVLDRSISGVLEIEDIKRIAKTMA